MKKYAIVFASLAIFVLSATVGFAAELPKTEIQSQTNMTTQAEVKKPVTKKKAKKPAKSKSTTAKKPKKTVKKAPKAAVKKEVKPKTVKPKKTVKKAAPKTQVDKGQEVVVTNGLSKEELDELKQELKETKAEVGSEIDEITKSLPKSSEQKTSAPRPTYKPKTVQPEPFEFGMDGIWKLLNGIFFS